MKICRNNIRHFQGIDPLATRSTLTGNQTHRRKFNLKTLVRLLKLQGRVGKSEELNGRRLLRNDSDRSQGENVVFGPADDQGVNVSVKIALSSCVPNRRVLGQAVVLVDNVIKQRMVRLGQVKLSQVILGQVRLGWIGQDNVIKQIMNVQWKPLNGIDLGQRQTDSNNRLIILSK